MQIAIPPVTTIFDDLSDWRKEKGKRFSLTSLMGFILLGILCGRKGPTAIARWGGQLPTDTHKRLGLEAHGSPSASTICRILWHVEVSMLEAQIEAWARQVQEQLIAAGLSKGVAIDGKTVRRAASLGAKNVHLLAAVCHQMRIVLKQLAVDDKTNEISVVPPLLQRIMLKGIVVTMDALLTQRAIATQIRRKRGHYVMIVKQNQPALYTAIEMLFLKRRFSILPPFGVAQQCSQGHGRIEIRTIFTSTALNDYLDWPGLQQVFLLKRLTERVKQGTVSVETVFGITSQTPEEASPAQLIQQTRDHWAAIENGTHWVRDVVLGEDVSTVRKATAPQSFAALRNLAISLARLVGFDSITEAIDAFTANPATAIGHMGFPTLK